MMCGGEVGRWRGGGLHGILWSPPAPGTSQGLVWDGGPSVWGASLGKSSPWLHAHPVRGPISVSQAGAALRLPELPPVGLGPRSPFLFSPLSPLLLLSLWGVGLPSVPEAGGAGSVLMCVLLLSSLFLLFPPTPNLRARHPATPRGINKSGRRRMLAVPARPGLSVVFCPSSVWPGE